MSRYPLKPLGDILTPSHDSVAVVPTDEYPIAGILSFGKGLFARETILGAETSYKKLVPLRTNQLVFGRLNAWEGGIAVVNATCDGMFVSQEFPVLDIDRSRADPSYVSHLCRWPDLWEALMQRSRGLGARSGARRLRVHEERLLEVEVPLPDVAEQRRVAEQVTSAVVHFEALESRLRARPPEDLLASIPVLLDAGFRRFTNVGAQVGELAETVSDTVHPGEDPGQATSFVGLQHVESHTGRLIGWIPLGDEKGRKFRFQPGDVVYGYLRPYLNKVWVADRHGLCSVDQYVLRPSAGVPASLLACALRTSTALDQAVELTHSLQLPRLRSGLLLNVTVPWPSEPTPATEALAQILERSCRLVDHRRRQSKTSQALIPSLLNQAFAGLL